MDAAKLKYIAIVLVFCFGPLIVLLIDSAIKKPENMGKSITDKHFTVEYPNWVLGFGVFGCVFVLIFMFFAELVLDEPVKNVAAFYAFKAIFYVVFFWLGIYLIICERTCKIVVYYDLITVYRPLRKNFSFNYSDIASVKLRRKKYYYYYEETITIVTKQGKKIRAENMEMQFERFCKLIKANVPNERIELGSTKVKTMKRQNIEDGGYVWPQRGYFFAALIGAPIWAIYAPDEWNIFSNYEQFWYSVAALLLIYMFYAGTIRFYISRYGITQYIFGVIKVRRIVWSDIDQVGTGYTDSREAIVITLKGCKRYTPGRTRDAGWFSMLNHKGCILIRKASMARSLVEKFYGELDY